MASEWLPTQWPGKQRRASAAVLHAPAHHRASDVPVVQMLCLNSEEMARGVVTCSTGNHALAFV